MVVVDRFEIFSETRERHGNGPAAKEEGDGKDGENKNNPEKKKEFMVDFFNKVELVKKALNEASIRIKDIERVRFDSLRSVTLAQEKEASDRLHKDEAEINAYLTVSKKHIDMMAEEDTSNLAPQEQAIRKNMQQALIRKFSACVKDLHTQTDLYRKEVQEKEVRQLGIAFPDKSPEEINEMVENGENTVQIVRQKMGGTHASVLDALNSVQDKYNDVRRLEKSMNELNQMFQDMARLVDAQGELIDNIGHCVQNANVNVVKGHEEVVQAEKYNKKKRKLCAAVSGCLTITIVVVVVLVVVL